MKRAVLAAAAFLALTALAPKAHAQGGGQGGGRGRMTEMLFKDITLTDVQKTKVDSIVAHYREMMPPRGDMNTPPDSATMAKRREIMTKQNADLRTLLTADQQTAFDKNVADMANRMGRRPGH
jgi:Spy/CpxP family protein refolding chaperone